MAVVQETTPTLAPFHFVPSDFDGMLSLHGTEAELRLAARCPCWNAQTGQPDPACMVCYPFGYVWDAPSTLKVFGPSRRGMRKYEMEGSLDVGDAWFTFPVGVKPPHYSRIVLTGSELVVDDYLTKGTEDRVRYSKVIQALSARYSTRDPSSGAPYTRENVTLGVGIDIALDTNMRDVLWGEPDPPVPDGTRYVLRLSVRPEYIVWEPQDRNEGGEDMPYRYLCKRLDYFLHPRGTAQEEQSY